MLNLGVRCRAWVPKASALDATSSKVATGVQRCSPEVDATNPRRRPCAEPWCSRRQRVRCSRPASVRACPEHPLKEDSLTHDNGPYCQLTPKNLARTRTGHGATHRRLAGRGESDGKALMTAPVLVCLLARRDSRWSCGSQELHVLEDWASGPRP